MSDLIRPGRSSFWMTYVSSLFNTYSLSLSFSLSLSLHLSLSIIRSTLPYPVHLTSFFYRPYSRHCSCWFFFCPPVLGIFFVVAYFISFTLRAKVGITGGVGGSRLIKWRVLFYYLDLCSGSIDCWCIAYAVGKHHLSNANVYTGVF